MQGSLTVQSVHSLSYANPSKQHIYQYKFSMKNLDREVKKMMHQQNPL